jgi:hypothetical protein
VPLEHLRQIARLLRSRSSIFWEAWKVKRGVTWLLLGLFSPVLIGCTIHQKFEQQSVAQTVANRNTLPLKVAVLSDRSMTFDYPRIASLRAFVEVMNPGLANTLQTAFNGRFQDVTVVENRQSAQSADLLLSPSLELSDPMRLTITFVEPDSGRQITALSSVRPFESHAPGMYAHIGTDLILFATVVVFPPTEMLVTRQIQKHDAERFNAIFAPAVAAMIDDIAMQASRDGALRAYAPSRGRYRDPALNHL